MKSKTYPMILAALFAALTAAGAFIRVPFVPVPFTLQILVVLLAGLTLGPVWAAASQGLYLAMGLMGLPVFSGGGGVGYVFSPSFGYLLGFVAGAAVTSAVARRLGGKNLWSMAVGCGAGLLVIYLLGVGWLYLALNLFAHTPASLSSVLVSGFLVFLPGDICKTAVACVVARALAARLRVRAVQ